MKIKSISILLLVSFLFLGRFTAFSQEFNDFEVRYQNNIKGDLTFISNSILNRDGGTNATDPEDAYNNLNTDNNNNPETGGRRNYNDYKDMQYINVAGGPGIFSSSTANFAFSDPSCNAIRYAGLYWSATYPSATANGFYNGTDTYIQNTVPIGQGRQNDFNQVRFRVPGGAYVNITADEVLYDGFTSADASVRSNSPYACYADVTALLTPLANPAGNYTVANIRATTGAMAGQGGSTGGWTLVIVYENPTLPGRLITTFDGFARVRGTNSVPINYSGFNTIPAGPVNADIGVAALEGDFRITGDGMQIQASGSAFPTTISNLTNPANNFFNSNITLNGVVTTNRTPNSINTLGYDTDIFRLSNPTNSVIPNNETSATFTFTTNGDQYYPFFNSFNVEIIEPEIVLEKKVNDIAGNNITGLGVNLGQVLDYVLSFQNIGNDNANNYTIRDVLPLNVTLDPSNFVLPTGVTYTFDSPTRTVTFSIPNNLVEKGDPIYRIRMRVQVAENCFDFIDACSDLIQNLAFSTYQGVINNNVITDDPSVTDFDNCGFVTPGATNFLLDDLSDCNFERTVELCGASVILNAGDNFDSYVWKRDDNGNGIFDASDTTINDGDPDNDPSTIVVNTVGTYIVDKIVADPCKGFKEIIHVVPYGSGTIPNPVIEYFNAVNSDVDPTNDLAGEIVQCSVDNALLPKLFLCGLNDSRQIQVNIVDAQSIVWERLNEGSCTAAGDDCANKNLSCTWSQVGVGNNFTVDNTGKFRLQVTYQNGCTSRFYFNVFQNTLDVQATHNDILCTTPGNITVTNPVSGYVYRLVDADTGTILQPFSTTRSFDFGPGQNGGYRVELTQVDNAGQPIPNACVFSTTEIGILERNVTYGVNVSPASCTGLGSINIQVNNAEPNYEYEIRIDDGSNGGQGTLLDNETAQADNNFTFSGLNPGNYIAIARTADGCFHSEQVTIIDENDLELDARVSQHITCKEGNILMDSDGGKTPHEYAIWSYVDEGGTTVISYPNVTDIPASEFQTSVIFDILNPGDYTFVVVDRNNCSALSNTVTIEFQPAADFNPTSTTDVLCFGEASGAIQFNLVSANGYQLTYYLFDGIGFDPNDYDVNNALATNSTGYFPGLPAGNYQIVINQRKGSADCDYFENHIISTPTNGLAADSAVVQDYTCAQEGIIQAQNVTGGTAPYSYSIDGITFIPDSTPGANTFTNLTDGTYTITIRDANNCTLTTNSVTLDPLNEPTDLSFVANAPNCPSLTSNVTVSVTNGNTPFVFDIIAPSAIAATTITGNTAAFNGLAPNTYTFRVTDNKGCFYTEDFTITPVDRIAVNGQLDNNITCFNLTDGGATFNVSNFSTTYGYSVTGPATFSGTAQTANSIPLTGLAAGTYTITVTDTTTSCTATANVTIAAPPAALVISNLTVVDLSCSTTGTVPGSVTITANNGWGSYEYELEDPVGGVVGPQSTNSFTGLTNTTGAYTVTVRDAGGCEVTGTFSLNPTVSPTLEVTANSLCYNSTTGLTLTANVTAGGVAPFQYRLNGGAYQSNTNFTGLGPGSYTVEVIDSKNCTGTASVTVFPTLTASASLIKDLDCSATPDAEIRININGGNPTFTYEVLRNGSSFQATTAVPSIPFSYFTTTAGTYEFIITDIENCSVTTNQIVISPNNPPTVVEVVADPLCNTSADGTAELQISGGIPPYAIVFNGSAPSTQATYSGLIAGTYNYTVTDTKGCVFSDSVTLTAPAVIIPGTIDLVQDYRCDNTSATLQAINYSGGTPGYTFSLDGVNFQVSDTFNSGITAGSYTITVKDINGCTAVTPTIVINALNPPSNISFAQTAPTCPAIVADVTLNVTDGTAPFTYEIIAPLGSVTNNGNTNVFSALNPGTYTFQVTDDKGCIIQRDYTVTDIDRVAVISQLTNNVSCFGSADGAFTFTVSDFISTYSYSVVNSATTVVQTQNNINTITPLAVTGLLADTYTVTITDDTTNCTATTTMVIENPPLALDFTFVNTPVTCTANSTITVTPIGGWGSYQYQLENTVGPAIVYGYQTPNTFSNVPAGSYTIYIRDAGNCIVSKPIVINPAQTPIIAIDATSDYCFDSTNQASLTINVTAGIAPYTYSINGGGQTAAVGNPFTITNLIPGTYNIQVRDAYGCVSNILNETIAPQLRASALVTKALDCTASPDAVIDVAINNGYTPYASYEVSTNGGTSWSAPVAVVGSNFTYPTSSAGTYDFRITDARNCTIITQAVIFPVTNPSITSLVQTVAILCHGDSGATIQVNLDNTLGLAPFAISVFNTTTSTNYGTQTSGLPAGSYDVTVTDAKSCTDTETIVIGEPAAITYDVNLVPITCNAATGTDPGSITVENVAGGTAEFEYHLTGNNGYNSTYTTTAGGEDHTFAILEFGIYEVDVVDVNGCSVRTTNIIASPPNDLDIDVSTATPDCTTGGTAIITVASIVGSGNYEFAILETYTSPYSSTYVPADLPGGDTATFTGLTPGVTYTFVVHDLTTLCYYFETAATPIDSPSNLTNTLDAVNNVSCTGTNDGSVNFSFDNYDSGATSVSYEIFNSQSNLTTGISGSSVVNPPAVGTGVSVSNLGPLSPGVYYILFSEVGGAFNGCSVGSAQFSIIESTNELDVTATVVKNDNCNVNAGQVSAVGQFGTTPYEYQIALSTDPAPTSLTWAGGTSNVFNVEGGNYIVYIKDAHGCIRFDPAIVPTDPSPEISLTTTNQCTADEGGYSITITLDAAGITPHTIRVDGGAPQSASGLVNSSDTITITNLGSGAHSVQILDANGCGETENITIYPPVNILANITADETCVPANAGEVTVTANGGSGVYSYRQVTPAGPTNGTGVFTGLTHSVAYTFEVEDTTTNCTETISVTLSTPAIPTFTLSTTNVSCNGGSDGSITVSLAPGNSDIPYEYSLDGGTTRQPSNVFSTLAQGTYNVTVISAKGCQDTKSITVNEPTLLDVSASASAFSCDDSASTITVTINDATPGNPSGTGSYVYSFDNGVNYQPGNTYQVPFGSPDVNVVVKDANHCTDAVIVPIPARQGVTAVINRLQGIDCTNNQEIIEIVPSNGSGTYTYTAMPSGIIVADPTNIILTLPGTYVYEILDTVTNCKVIVEHIIAPYDLINVTAVVTTDATCSDSSDGIIEVTIRGYTGTFDYQVLDNTGTPIGGTLASDNATSDPYIFNVASTLPAGIYSIRITETAFPECIDVSNKITIDAPEPLVLQLVDNVNANCIVSDAIVTVQATGGTGPYTYGASISGGGVPGTFAFDNTIELDPTTSLNWDIYVRDTNGCIIAVPLAVSVNTDTTPDITLAINDECADEGSFGITVSLDAINFGVAPYTMSINGGAFQSTASFPYTYTGLNAGAQTIIIRDANGCGETENITIEPELLVSAVVLTQSTCATNDGVVEFTIVGGSGANTAELLRSDLTPTGIVPIGNQFTGVAFGDYIVRITDNTLGTPNCFADAPISLEEPTPVTLLTTDKTDVSCAGASDGSITINLEPSGVGVNDNPPYTFEITDGTSTFTQNTNFFTGLPAGTWDITVTSNRNCFATDQVVIIQPLALTASITNVVPFACDVNNAQQLATIEVTITSGTGTPNYFYSVNGGSFLPTGGTVFTHNVNSAGNYDIIIRDANSCLFNIPTQVIDPLNSFAAVVTLSDAITCVNGREEVLITVTDDGNPHTYTYELLPLGNPNGAQTATTGNTATFELTAVGNYTFRITDTVTGCYIDTAAHNIAPYDLIEVTATAVESVICYGDTNGSLEISVTGLTGTTGAYDYEVFTQAGASYLTGSGNTSTNPLLINGLSGGNYYVTVTETDPTSTLCSDNSNVITIISPDMQLTAIVNPLANVTCTNDKGEILVDPNGGVAPYDIILTNTDTGQVYTANNVLSFVFTGLSAENYTVSITDSARSPGCIITDTEILIEPSQIVANATPLTTNLACYGDTTGTVTANVTSGGSGTYQYRLNRYDAAGAVINFTSGSQSNSTFTGLRGGVYSITVSDGWNCDVETNQVTIDEPTRVSASLVRTSALTCVDGVEFLLTATGGRSGSYQFSTDNVTWSVMTSNPMPLPASGSLGAGTYQYYVRDAVNLCASVVSNSITENPIIPLELTVDTSAAFINCNGDSTAIIYASADFGMGNYQYELYNNYTGSLSDLNNLDPTLLNPSDRIVGPASNGTFGNLAAGTYYVNVFSNDCNAKPQQVIIAEPEPLDFDTVVVDVLCFGDENGSISVNAVVGAGGAGGYIYAISPNLNQFDTKNTFTNLAPGDYIIIAQDQNGCFEYIEETIGEPTALAVSAVATPEICAGNDDGTIALTIADGTAPYSTALNSNADADFIQGRVDFADLAAGSYLVFVRDANGCEIYVEVEVEAGVNLNATIEPIYECTGDTPNNYINITLEDASVIGDVLYALDSTDAGAMQLNADFRNIAAGSHYIAIAHSNGCVITIPFEIEGFEPLTVIAEQHNLNEITATAQGGKENYTYYFDDVNNGTDNTFRIRRSDTYTVRVVDENGCEAVTSIYIEFIDIEIPNFFSPGGDGLNDTWKPKNMEAFPEILTIVFDRYGREVYRLGYNDQGWNGIYHGKELPSGDYWYVIKLKGAEDDREFVGHFTLYR